MGLLLESDRTRWNCDCVAHCLHKRNPCCLCLHAPQKRETTYLVLYAVNHDHPPFGAAIARGNISTNHDPQRGVTMPLKIIHVLVLLMSLIVTLGFAYWGLLGAGAQAALPVRNWAIATLLFSGALIIYALLSFNRLLRMKGPEQ